ncbi:hypothetical protein CH252_04975 [Rhodococcus sp. 06-1477-1B]|nr:hypothetical protein CH252_04975 [Rhodococcus sp. 06-1477-1B]
MDYENAPEDAVARSTAGLVDPHYAFNLNTGKRTVVMEFTDDFPENGVEAELQHLAVAPVKPYSGWWWKAPLAVAAGLALTVVLVAGLLAVFSPSLFAYATDVLLH